MGYVGYSMSENAVEAYDNGEMPMSSWRKKDIFQVILKERAKCQKNQCIL